MSTEVKRRYSLEEYLELERESEVKHEFWNGEIYAMSGGTLGHDQIMGNVFDALRTCLREKDCRVFTNNMQIKVPAAPPYRYADASVVCGKVEVESFNGNDLLLNPVLLVEVLSPTTEAFDRGDKSSYYKSIPSFREYLLVAQHRPHITQLIKTTETSWTQIEVNDVAGSIYLPSIDCTLALAEVYRDIEFSAETIVNLPRMM
jgi:Uma2 family endonuclease